MSSENGMSPEELANLYHGPEATTGPEARPRCMICGSRNGVRAGRCPSCMATEVVRQTAQEEQESSQRREAHFCPDSQAQDPPPPPPGPYHPQNPSFQERLRKQQQRQNEFDQELSKWSEAREAREIQEHQKRMSEIRQDNLQFQLQPVPPIPSLGAGSPPKLYYVPGWQRWIHIVTEAVAVAAVPMLFSAAKAAPEPHRTRLKVLAWATLTVDGFLLYRWLTNRE